MGSQFHDDDAYDDRAYDDDDRDQRRVSRPGRRGFCCPYCGSTDVPITKSKISAAGWVVFAVLLVFCFPLFWIGLFIKEDFKECADCGTKVGG